MNLSNKIILITGSTDGLGKKLAQELTHAGAKVIIHGRDSQKVAETVQELGAHDGVVCDFNQPELIPAAFAQITKLDILINNAGTWLEGATTEARLETILQLVHVNLASHLVTTRTLLPILEQAEFGQILNVVSVAGIEIPFDYFHTIYSATKFGMQAFSEATAKEYMNKNIRVMGFYPGGMETKLFEKAGDDYQPHEPWMFDPQESVEAMMFMLTRNQKVNIKRLDLVNQLLQ